MNVLDNPQCTLLLRRFAVLAVALMPALFITPEVCAQWTQWGGRDRLFKADSKALATEWPADGPPEIWSRRLGEGYSAILADRGRLYTMYRAANREIVISLDAQSGKTLWKYSYDSSPHEGHADKYGRGPRATPLLTDGLLYTVGVGSVMHCLDADTGRMLWSHDLWREFDGNLREHGYASSPIAYKHTVITLVGGEGQSIVAFDKKDGSVAWKNLSFKNAYSSPKIMRIDGEDHLVAFMAEHVIGVDPSNGRLKWQFPFTNEWEQNVSMPVLTGNNLLFVSTVLSGARGFTVTKDGNEFDVRQLWFAPKVQVSHVSAVQIGDYIYASSGTWSPYFMLGLNVRTGKVAWRERAFPKANVVYADGRLIILDERGNLALTTATPDGLAVHSKVKLFDSRSWTVPTIAGRTLYVRDQEQIMALDLGISTSVLKKGTGSELIGDSATEKRLRGGACPLFQQAPTSGDDR
jgi:outer membrane protein assembly factor BamB